MANITIKINGLDKIRRAVKEHPKASAPILANGLNTSVAVIIGMTQPDSIFRFRTPRAQRTGNLARSFNYGVKKANRFKLEASVGPTVNYAPAVFYGLGGRRPNPYMDRIAKAAEPKVQKVMQKTLQDVVNLLK